MNYLLNIFAAVLFICIVKQNIKANTSISALEILDENNSMVTTALFEKINWIIKQMLHMRLHEYRAALHVHDVKQAVEELFKQQDLRTEGLLLNMQQEVLKNLDLQNDLLKNISSNLYNLQSYDVKPFKSNRNWQTILRRQDGSQSFIRNWNEYKTGFGQENGEYFIGLETLHAMTTYADPQELLIILRDFDNQTRYAKYSDFMIGSEAEKFKIKKIGKYQGDAGDSFSQHLYCKFSTFDQDNDNTTTSNCALSYQGGWWFSSCYNSHLTGIYLLQPEVNEASGYGIIWYSWHGLKKSLKYVEMMIRPK